LRIIFNGIDGCPVIVALCPLLALPHFLYFSKQGCSCHHEERCRYGRIKLKYEKVSDDTGNIQIPKSQLIPSINRVLFLTFIHSIQ